VADGVPVCGDIELFARAAGDTPVLAITGSNGKSTATSMLASVLEADGRHIKVGGNLGMPALSLLDDGPPEMYVLELSSFQLETTHTLEPRVAALLNVSADHMDRYPDVESYARAKERIFHGRGAMVLNGDDPRVVAMAMANRRVVFFGLDEPGKEDFGRHSRDGEAWLCHGDTAIIASRRLGIVGSHNVANALAAMAMAHVVGASHGAMADALAAFHGLPHRCQLVAESDGVRWYDDSKATNVGATTAAIRGLEADGRLVLIAGGDGKGADFTPLRQVVAEHVRAAVLMGRDAPAMASALAGAAPVHQAASMAEAVGIALAEAHEGDSVLLAPACASFDMYSDYQERGDDFAAQVKGQIAP
jgi:UDP-N-acetylmuramoylalanine--D-glutamate ligase